MALAGALFVGVTITGFVTLPRGITANPWAVVVLVAVAAPVTLVANAVEYQVIARISGYRVRFVEASNLTVMATAANLLPIPGGVLIRTQALKSKGSSYRRAVGANACAGLAWIGCAAIAVAAVAVGKAHQRTAAFVIGFAGVALVAAVGVILLRIDRPLAHRRFLELVTVEFVTLLVGAVRIFVAFRAIGLSADGMQAIALAAATPVAAAAGIFPGGLGLRELLAAAIGTAVSLPASEAVAATAVDRIAGLVTASIVATAMVSIGARWRGPLGRTKDGGPTG